MIRKLKFLSSVKKSEELIKHESREHLKEKNQSGKRVTAEDTMDSLWLNRSLLKALSYVVFSLLVDTHKIVH